MEVRTINNDHSTWFTLCYYTGKLIAQCEKPRQGFDNPPQAKDMQLIVAPLALNTVSKCTYHAPKLIFRKTCMTLRAVSRSRR